MIVAMQDMRSSYYQPDPRLLPTSTFHDTDEHFQNNGLFFAEHRRGLFLFMALPFFQSHFAGGLSGMLRMRGFPPRHTYLSRNT